MGWLRGLIFVLKFGVYIVAKTAKTVKKEVGQGDESAFSPSDIKLLSYHGVEGIIRIGLQAAHERVIKNRIIAFAGVLLLVSVVTNVFLSTNVPEPLLLGETSDGRIRPLPLLSEPLYNHKDILSWSERCVKDIYSLSYVDWQESIQNNTFCLSDNSRSGFVDSLATIGVLKYLTPEMQGIVYATAGKSVLRGSALTPGGYKKWIVDVPYTVTVSGRNAGRIDLVMTMEIRRVSLTWRESGIWVERYVVNPAGNR